MAEARIYPPSEQRIAEARRAGHVPRASLVAFSCALVGASWLLDSGGERCLRGLAHLWQALLTEYSRGRVPDVAPVLFERLPSVLWPVAAMLMVVFVASVGFSFLAQGSARRVPLARGRHRFAALRPAIVSKLLWSLLVLVLSVAALHDFSRATLPSAGATVAQWLWRCAALSVLVAVFDAAIARALFMRSLWLTRREYLDEQREAYGAPELRAERSRLNHERRALDASEAT